MPCPGPASVSVQPLHSIIQGMNLLIFLESGGEDERMNVSFFEQSHRFMDLRMISEQNRMDSNAGL